MKNRIIVFKILAAIVAAGGAFASVNVNSAFAATSVYVRYTTQDSDLIHCVMSGTCETSGTWPCVVRVQIGSSPSTTTPGKATIYPYITCQIGISTTNTTPFAINNLPIFLPSDARIW